jgi:D-alanyl-D-alanine carboxypeptidase
MKTVITSLLLMSFSYIYGQIDPALATEFQDILNDQISNGNNGVSACVIMPDGSEWHGQAGVDKDGNDVVPETVFHGASNCKTHVSTCLVLLAEQGLVNLDAPWSEYVSLDVDFDPEITVRQLVNNTSGIADYLEIASSGAYAISDPSYFYTPEEILEDIVSQTPDFAAGTDFHYSTSNFVLAGLIIESVTSLPLYDALRQEIWTPLGLEHTYGGAYDEYDEPRAGVWWNFGFGFNNYSGVDETSMLSFGYGGAGIVTNSIDQAKFIRALLTGELVSDTSLQQMLEFIPESYDDWSAGYGMGLHHAVGVGTDEVIGVDGFYTNMSSTFHSLTDGFSVNTLTNTQGTWYGIFTPIYDAIKSYLANNVESIEIGTTLHAWPNPTSKNASVSVFNLQVESILVTDIAGTVQTCDFVRTGDLVDIDLSDLRSGIYQIRILSGNAPDHFVRLSKLD